MKEHKTRTENPLLKEYLFTALIKLMDQKDFKDIKISEIAQKAGVSRMTYYRTYESKEDILIQYFKEQAEKATAQLKGRDDLNAEESLTLFFNFFKEQAHLLEYLQKAGLLKEVGFRFANFISDTYEHHDRHLTSPAYKSYEVNFIAGGIFLILMNWVERDLRETPNELARMTMEMLRIPFSEPAE